MTSRTVMRPIKGSTHQLSVSGTSARAGAFVNNDVSIYCATACFVKFGGSTVTAATNNYDIYVPASTRVDLRSGGNTHLAVILASGSDTAYINEWSKKAE